MRLWEIQAGAVFDTDKKRDYLDIYERNFGEMRGDSVRLLELGVHTGGSLRMWSSYFQNGHIFGYDLAPPDTSWPDNVKVAAGDQANRESLHAAMSSWGCDTFDIIIDDAAHLGSLAAATFAFLFDEHLAPGGFYCLEDWGTGYWEDWPDGERLAATEDWLNEVREQPKYPPFDRQAGAHLIPSHTAGMVGLVKFLIDHMAAPDATPPLVPLPTRKIESMSVHLGVAVVRKAAPPAA